MILTPTCYLLKRGNGYLLALNESGNDAAQLSAADLAPVARLLQMAADFQMLDQQHDVPSGSPASSQPRSGDDSAESFTLGTPVAACYDALTGDRR